MNAITKNVFATKARLRFSQSNTIGELIASGEHIDEELWDILRAYPDATRFEDMSEQRSKKLQRRKIRLHLLVMTLGSTAHLPETLY